MIFPIYSKLFQNPSKAQLSSILKFSSHIELIKVDGILNKELLTRPTEWEKSNTSSDTSLASEPDHLNLTQQLLAHPPMQGTTTGNYK